MGIHFRYFIFNLRWKIQNGQLKKSHENDNAYPGPLAQLLLKPLLTVTQLTESIGGGMGMLAPVPLTFKTLG